MAANDINEFVSETTQGNIPRLLEESDLRDAQMVLVNAAFFKGIWKYSFLSNDTFLAPFRADPSLSFQGGAGTPPNGTGMVSMMNQTASFKYGKNNLISLRFSEMNAWDNR